MPHHIMLDLETMGTRPGCKIVAIGAVEFSAEGLGPEFYVACQLTGQDELSMDAGTVTWWLQQGQEARAALFIDALPLDQTLREFSDFLDSFTSFDQGDVVLWGNGADFDNAILAAAYAAKKLEQPWKFYHNRCYRTLKGLAPDLKAERLGTHHQALDDAKTQALHAIRLLKHLGVWA